MHLQLFESIVSEIARQRGYAAEVEEHLVEATDNPALFVVHLSPIGLQLLEAVLGRGLVLALGLLLIMVSLLSLLGYSNQHTNSNDCVTLIGLAIAMFYVGTRPMKLRLTCQQQQKTWEVSHDESNFVLTVKGNLRDSFGKTIDYYNESLKCN